LLNRPYKYARDLRIKRKKQYYNFFDNKTYEEIKSLLKSSNRSDVAIINFFVRSGNKPTEIRHIECGMSRQSRLKGVECLVMACLLEFGNDHYWLKSEFFEFLKKDLIHKTEPNNTLFAFV